jgi:hypothetical protein
VPRSKPEVEAAPEAAAGGDEKSADVPAVVPESSKKKKVSGFRFLAFALATTAADFSPHFSAENFPLKMSGKIGIESFEKLFSQK